MRITITLDLSPADVTRTGSNSIERVINTSIEMAHQVGETHPNILTRDDADVNWQDWEDLKPLVVRLWWAAQNAIREQRLADLLEKKEPQP